MGEKWEGGDMRYAGGGHKIVLLRKALKAHSLDENKIVMFTDRYVCGYSMFNVTSFT